MLSFLISSSSLSSHSRLTLTPPWAEVKLSSSHRVGGSRSRQCPWNISWLKSSDVYQGCLLLSRIFKWICGQIWKPPVKVDEEIKLGATERHYLKTSVRHRPWAQKCGRQSQVREVYHSHSLQQGPVVGGVCVCVGAPVLYLTRTHYVNSWPPLSTLILSFKLCNLIVDCTPNQRKF